MTTSTTSASLLGAKVTSYEAAQNATAASKSSKEMGKQDFLTLFTAQLKSQNPLDPVKNEAFVAQLAQFSQLEALTNMQTSMDNLVGSLSSERLLGSTSLIGKKISVADGLSPLGSSGGIDATLHLPNGASGIQLSIKDSKGQLVQELIAGPQSPGTASLRWDGTDAMGNRVPADVYRLSATAVVNGKTSSVPVNTLSTVRAVSTAPDGAISLQVEGGQIVPLKDITRIDM